MQNDKYKVSRLIENFGNYWIPETCRNGVGVDVGSNNGGFLDRYRDFFGEIHAYEPNIFLIKLLKEKFKDHPNIHFYNEAVADVDGKILALTKYKESDENGSFAIYKDYLSRFWDPTEVICEATSVSFETVIRRCSKEIDYLKLDCETGEYEFLLNRDLSGIKYIGMELHNQLGKAKYEELYNFVARTHYCGEPCAHTEGQHQELFFINKKLPPLEME